jgi:hypothetical protein
MTAGNLIANTRAGMAFGLAVIAKIGRFPEGGDKESPIRELPSASRAITVELV